MSTSTSTNMNIVRALQEKKCHFYTILHPDNKDLGVVFMIWEEKLGGFVYLHKMKIRLVFFGLVLFLYERYEALFHYTENNTVFFSDRNFVVENIFLNAPNSSKLNSLIKAINDPSIPVYFSRLSWGKIMCCREFNTLVATNIQSICCIEYAISPSFFVSHQEREKHVIQDELEKEKYTIEQENIAILSSESFKNI